MLSGSLSQQIPHKVWARPAGSALRSASALVFTHLCSTLAVRFLRSLFCPISLTATSTTEPRAPSHVLRLCPPTLPLRAGLGGGGKKSPKRSSSMSAQPRPRL